MEPSHFRVNSSPPVTPTRRPFHRLRTTPHLWSSTPPPAQRRCQLAAPRASPHTCSIDPHYRPPPPPCPPASPPGRPAPPSPPCTNTHRPTAPPPPSTAPLDHESPTDRPPPWGSRRSGSPPVLNPSLSSPLPPRRRQGSPTPPPRRRRRRRDRTRPQPSPSRTPIRRPRTPQSDLLQLVAATAQGANNNNNNNNRVPARELRDRLQALLDTRRRRARGARGGRTERGRRTARERDGQVGVRAEVSGGRAQPPSQPRVDGFRLQLDSELSARWPSLQSGMQDPFRTSGFCPPALYDGIETRVPSPDIPQVPRIDTRAAPAWMPSPDAAPRFGLPLAAWLSSRRASPESGMEDSYRSIPFPELETRMPSPDIASPLSRAFFRRQQQREGLAQMLTPDTAPTVESPPDSSPCPPRDTDPRPGTVNPGPTRPKPEPEQEPTLITTAALPESHAAHLAAGAGIQAAREKADAALGALQVLRGAGTGAGCVICHERHADSVFRPCGHLVMCSVCVVAKRVGGAPAGKRPVVECPVRGCGSVVEATIKAFRG